MSGIGYFFDRLFGAPEGQVWKSIHPSTTLVLYSVKTGLPIAAIIFDTDAESLVTRRSRGKSEEYFNLACKDETPLKIIFCNLLPDTILRFNITDDNGERINQVNVAYPRTAITVRSDLRAGNLLMRVSSAMVTVGEDEAASPGDQKGSYFHFSVAPESDMVSKYEEDFQSVVWKPAEYFVCEDLPITKEMPQSPTPKPASRLVAMGGLGLRAKGCVLTPKGGGGGGIGSSGRLTEEEIRASEAGKITHGEKIDVQSIDVQMKFTKFDNMHMMLNFSLVPGLKLLSPLSRDDVMKLAAESIRDKVKLAQELESMTMFVSDVCVICIGNPPEHTLAPCGHKCLCTDCKSLLHIGDSCCLCRGRIVEIV